MEKKEEKKLAPSTLDLAINSVDQGDGTGLIHLSVVPPAAGPRKPSVFICMLDDSGSMGLCASNKEGSEGDGFNRLDLVKHSVKTIIHMLGPQDYLALIAFNVKATLLLKVTQMTDKNKKLAIAKLETIEDNGGTNIWDALKVAIDLTKGSDLCRRLNTALLLFTDGEPNENPPAGIVPTLKEYLGDAQLPFTIHTFGYGYNLDSQLLLDIALVGTGMYSYIPDCTMVGTTFVNFLSNCLAHAVKAAYVNVVSEPPLDLACIGYAMQKGTITVGAVQYGQTRDFVLQFKLPAAAPFTLTARLSYEGQVAIKTVTDLKTGNPADLYRQLCRCRYSSLMTQGIAAQSPSALETSFLGAIKAEIDRWPTKSEESMRALIRDFESPNDSEGQVGKALSQLDWWQKWGMHYVRSLVRAHQLQQCHNFKDPGVQGYGGKPFRELQDQTDKLFISLPPPKASIQTGAAPPVNMQSYMDVSSGCFDGEGLVQLTNGSIKMVKDLVQGDELLNSDGVPAHVVSLVQIRVQSVIEVVTLSGVYITPWHPVRVDGVWKFPHDVKATEQRYCEHIYNLVLDVNHVVTINGVDLITLGHGKTDNSVVEHSYFGTNRVLDDLKKFAGWDTGHVLIEQCHTSRNLTTGLVQAIY